MITPRTYQAEALDAVLAFRKQGTTRQLISLPTATGKTIIFSLIVKEANTRTLIICPSEELITQARDKLLMVWPEADIGIVKAKQDELDHQIIIASIQTVYRSKRLARLKQCGFELMIVDEAHHAVARSYITVIKELGFLNDDPDKLLVGLTATPVRGDKIGLKAVFQEIVFDRSIGVMINAGYLTHLVGERILTKTELDGIVVRRGDFVLGELSRIINTPARNELIVSNYKKFAKDRRRTLVFCCDVRHAVDLAELFSDHGIEAKAIYGDMKHEERTGVKEAFKTGACSVLTNCALLAEGYDQDTIDCIILARPTKSIGLYIQQIGRGVRLHPQKKDCLILDFCDNSSRHDLRNFSNTLGGAVQCLLEPGFVYGIEECIDSDVREMAYPVLRNGVAVYQEGNEVIEFFDKSQFAWCQVGGSWHLKLSESRDVWLRQAETGFLVVAQDSSRVVELSNRPLPLDYALGVAEDWARSRPRMNMWGKKNAAWRSLPASRNQLATLRLYKIPHNETITKGEASLLLDSKISEPATPKQKQFLSYKRIKHSPLITKTLASKLISKFKVGTV